MKATSFHPTEKISSNQFPHVAQAKSVAEQAAAKGLKMSRASFGVGHFIFLPAKVGELPKRIRFTSYTKLVEFVVSYIPEAI